MASRFYRGLTRRQRIDPRVLSSLATQSGIEAGQKLRQFYPVYVRAYNTVGGVLTQSLRTVVNFDAISEATVPESVVTGSDWRFIAPTNGIYIFTGVVCVFSAGTTTGGTYVDIELASGAILRGSVVDPQGTSGNTNKSCGFQGVLQMATGDAARIKLGNFSTVNKNLASGVDTNITIALVVGL